MKNCEQRNTICGSENLGEKEELYVKNKSMAQRRKNKALFKKRLIKNAEVAKKNLRKRRKEDYKNCHYYSTKKTKSGVKRYKALNKKAGKVKT